MRQFIAKKRIKVPRYKLCYFLLAFSILLIFVVNLVIHFFLNFIGQESFFDLFLGNSFGNILEYRMNYFPEDYLYQNAFGFSLSEDEMVWKENDSLENIVDSDLKDVVYIYNTFQTDKYKSNYFSSYSINSFVTQASFMLQEYLKEYSVGSIVEQMSVVQVLKEEGIPYTNSYAATRILLEKRTSETPSLEYYFDLQVSDYEYEATTAHIEGATFAKILFVVGTDYGNYELNQAFAQRLNEILENISPDLSRGISLRGGEGYQGVYNQDFSPRTLLIQVGGVNNTIDEVNRSLKVLAQVISTYIEEVKNEKE